MPLIVLLNIIVFVFAALFLVGFGQASELGQFAGLAFVVGLYYVCVILAGFNLLIAAVFFWRGKKDRAQQIAIGGLLTAAVVALLVRVGTWFTQSGLF